MSHGLKYQTQVTSQSDPISGVAEQTYTVQFLFKDYTGSVRSITGGTNTIIPKTTTDESNPAIKGQAFDLRLYCNGDINIKSFYSEDDDGIMVKVLNSSSAIMWIGFIVQDDSYELKVDFGHEITLSATDSLGLLKGVILSDLYVTRANMTGTFLVDTILGVNVFHIDCPLLYISVGDVLNVFGGSYTVTAVTIGDHTVAGNHYGFIVVTTPQPTPQGPTTTTFSVAGRINLYQKNYLSTILSACLSATNLKLNLNIFCNVFEQDQDLTKSHFEQTLVDSQVFLNGDTFDNCYSVLEKILQTFRCTIFQANGAWNIVHFDELRRYPSGLPGFAYDDTFTLLGTALFNNVFNIGVEPQPTRPLFGLTEGIVRPYKFVRKQFDYKQPKYLLQNYDLQKVGALLRDYYSGAYHIKEYVAIGFERGFGTPLAERFIRVEIDSSGTETDRYLVIRGDTYDQRESVQGEPFEANAGDKLIFGCSVRTNVSPLVNIPYRIKSTDGVTNKFVNNDQTWTTTGSFVYNLSGANTWGGFEIKTDGIPYTGFIYINFTEATPNPQSSSKETHYKDIRLEYIPYINETTKIIGHAHKDEQDKNIKNKSDNILYLDDSPRNSIVGTLFLASMEGLLQKRTRLWRYKDEPYSIYRLGEMMVKEELMMRSISRSRLEGSFVGVIQNNPISLLTTLVYDKEPTKVYISGLLSIDYKHNQFSGTLYEILDSSQGVFYENYSFTYLYSAT